MIGKDQGKKKMPLRYYTKFCLLILEQVFNWKTNLNVEAVLQIRNYQIITITVSKKELTQLDLQISLIIQDC